MGWQESRLPTAAAIASFRAIYSWTDLQLLFAWKDDAHGVCDAASPRLVSLGIVGRLALWNGGPGSGGTPQISGCAGRKRRCRDEDSLPWVDAEPPVMHCP